MDLQIEPGNSKTRFVRFLLTCLLFPISLNFVAYFGFVTAYSRDEFTLTSFSKLYDNDVFRYRIFSKELLYLIYNIITKLHRVVPVQGHVARFLKTDSLALYFSFFLLNTIFLCAASCMLFACFRSPRLRGSAQEKRLWLVFLIFLMVMTQYVVTPYDAAAYFFLSASIFLMLCPRSLLTLAGLAAVLVIATLNRETALLTVSLYATLCILRKRLFTRESLFELALLLGAFLLPYTLLRVKLGWDHALASSSGWENMLHQNSSYAGIALTLCLFGIAMSFQDAARWKAIWIFLGISAPYIVLIVLTGIWFEVRLCVPLIICIVMLNLWDYEDNPALTPRTTGSRGDFLAGRIKEKQGSNI